MNNKQREIVTGAAVVVRLMLLFPPFLGPRGLGLGYGFLLSPPGGGSVNVGQLFAQWVGVGVIAGLAWWLSQSPAD